VSSVITSAISLFAMWDPMKPAPPPMQTLMTPFEPISSGWAFLKSLPKLFPILDVWRLKFAERVEMCSDRLARHLMILTREYLKIDIARWNV
jgi:hypothetical protein